MEKKRKNSKGNHVESATSPVTDKKSNPEEGEKLIEHPKRNIVKNVNAAAKKEKSDSEEDECHLTGQPVPVQEAKKRWPHRYLCKSKWANKSTYAIEWNDEEILQASRHFTEALVDGDILKLLDDVYIQAEEGQQNYIAKIVEFFETTDKEQYLTAQWFYRAEDTVIKNHAQFIDNHRVFFSDIKDDNPLGCIVSKVKIVDKASNVDKKKSQDYFCDMSYKLPYLTFANLVSGVQVQDSGSDTSSTISSDNNSIEASAIDDATSTDKKNTKPRQGSVELKNEMTLLDLYCGCGAMSTGLCLGASLSGVKLVNRWAVDFNDDACVSLRKNHPETEVRNESADDFLSLLKEWEKLCNEIQLTEVSNSEEDGEDNDDSPLSPGEFEVESLLDICFVNKHGLYFKGNVDVICGGPPCQGVSGFNRFRDKTDPLKDPKNHQLVVFMDIIDFLRPKYVLMENVVDLLKFAGGFLGRYAIGRLVGMDYQTRSGIMAAGSYGLPQFRLRVFLWGAHTSKKLPQFPLPTHNVVTRGGVPNEFEDIYVSHGKNSSAQLEKALLLEDAISDLPPVTNYEEQDEMPYEGAARSEFQRYIRLNRKDMVSFNGSVEIASDSVIYDHRPLQLNTDDYQRVCQIPKEKGANFRSLPGLIVNSKNKVELDPSMERVLLPSKKPLVPDYAISFVRGCSPKPFGRLWWDETVSTVVTRAEPHNQAVLHPSQDRVLTVRENARLQGFLDCYKLYGSIKERYKQVGNAVATPVATALGYALGMASKGLVDEKPLSTLPFKFPQCLALSQG
ncbi:hypothetical protein RDABS01_004951 [Bienertia sinuspersici]